MRRHARLRRMFAPYLEGGLPPKEARRVEDHVHSCESCRDELARMGEGLRFARKLARPGSGDAIRPPAFTAPGEEPASLRPPRGGRLRFPASERWDRLTSPATIQTAMALVLIAAAFLAVTGRRSSLGERAARLAKSSGLDVSDYQPTRIPDLPANTRPYIATEGYVREVYLDPVERTLHFKLVEAAHGIGPFVICEILSPAGMAVPSEGSRIRVYGVARFDAQPGRQWYEVNPVLDFLVLKR